LPKLKVQPKLFWSVCWKNFNRIRNERIGFLRDWINYLAIYPDFQVQGYGQHMMENVEAKLRKTGCPKINL
jgi:GNAT superfamily N-acetyltransferase